MALRKMLSKRYRLTSQTVTLECPPSPSIPPNAARNNFLREYPTSSESADKGFFRRFLHRKAINQLPDFLSVPVGEMLREKLRGISVTGDRLRLDGLAPPPPPATETATGDRHQLGISVEDARKLLRLSQVEKLKARIRQIPQNSVSYSEFVRICVGECGNEDQGVEYANMLDRSGNVIVLGNVVFVRPEQVANSMEKLISQFIATPSDPRRKQLEQLEQQKRKIDEEAQAQVRYELYGGLGFVLIQTLALMRLTFWELSWDVMEPICFFVTSLHFAIGYGFFLKTSTEPSFEGYFQRRFKSKQKKLMRVHNFDIDKYNDLRKTFYPDHLGNAFSVSGQ